MVRTHRIARVPVLLAALFALAALAQSPALEARFIGNMAVAISDGAVTLMTDFPYQSGYSGYMAYRPEAIRSTTPHTLALITHRHADHWDRVLFEKTGWQIAGPADVVAGVPAGRVVPLTPRGTFEGMHIEALDTPHSDSGHYSYVVTWHGRRFYFSGDTESIDHLVELKNLDVAFISPWLYQSALKRGQAIHAKRIVIYHHRQGQQVPNCTGRCSVPRQGETLVFS